MQLDKLEPNKILGAKGLSADTALEHCYEIDCIRRRTHEAIPKIPQCLFICGC